MGEVKVKEAPKITRQSEGADFNAGCGGAEYIKTGCGVAFGKGKPVAYPICWRRAG